MFTRHAEADFDEKLVNIAQLARPLPGASGVDRIAGQQVVEMPQMRTAAAGVGDDRVEPLRRQQVDQPAGERPRRGQIAVMGVERPAARLHRWRVHLAAVFAQHVHRRPVHVGQHEVLHAAGQHGHPVAALAAGRPAR